MWKPRSLGWPITLGVVMIVLLVAILVGWILGFIRLAIDVPAQAPLYWTLLGVGTGLLVLVLVGVVLYLLLSVKEIRLNQRQSNFIDSVTHELKSPIASLKLYLQTISRRPMNDVQRAQFHRFMLEDVQRLDTLIDHLLDAARLEQQAPLLEPEELDLGALLEACARTVCLRYRLPASTIALDVPPLAVLGRRVEVEMVFRNLLDNAVKYAAGTPQVEIQAAAAGPLRVRVQIADNGPGIPARLRRKIFGRFVRLGSELERSRPGTGLGLYIVRSLVTRMKGHIAVRDRGDRSGTLFEVELPGRPRQPADATPPLAASERREEPGELRLGLKGDPA
jgi:signal transduction histidine kinase